MSKSKEDVKAFMFARWITTCYGSELLDDEGVHSSEELFNPKTAGSLLNKSKGIWWKEQLKHFNEVVWPNYVKNGSVKATEDFLC